MTVIKLITCRIIIMEVTIKAHHFYSMTKVTFIATGFDLGFFFLFFVFCCYSSLAGS